MSKTLKELNLEDDFLFAKVMSNKEVRVILYSYVHLIYLKLEGISIHLKLYVLKIVV